jgi:hypothetical protein
MERTVAVYTQPELPTILHLSDALEGGDVLPGLSVRLQQFFAVLGVHGG